MAKGPAIGCVLFLLHVVVCYADAIPNTNARGRSRFRNESVNSREAQILSVFDTVLNAIDSKLKKIDSLERTIERLTSKFEEFDVRHEEIVEQLQALDQRLSKRDEAQFSEPSAIELEPKIAAIDEKVSSIDSKIISIVNHFDNSIHSVDNDTYKAFASQESYTILNRLEDESEDNTLREMKTQIGNMDKNLRYLTEFVGDKMNRMLNLVADVKGALMGGEEIPTTTPRPANLTADGSSGSKLDALFKTMSPLLGVSEKMDEVWDVLVGTKSSVDTLVPNSEQLLWQTQRQERAIIDIHSDLNASVQQIIENLNMVEKHLSQQKNRTAVKVEIPTTTTQATTTTTTEYTSTPRFINEPISLPTDLMDKEFLGDEPIIPKNSSKTTEYGTTQIPYDYWNKTRNNTTTSVVFPSVKNKPTFNGSFYDPIAPQNIKGHSCAELYEQGLTESGIYYLLIRDTAFWYIKVYCDMETEGGGWTLIQRRDDFGEPRENFNRDWEDYKAGFGEPLQEFWLGNENIYMVTNAEDYSLRVELEDFEGNQRFAEYSSFKLYSEKEQYKLEIGGYSGNAGDSLNDPWYGSNLSPFSTYNRDNDRSSLNCASMLKGGWWWKSCGRGLNGYYLTDPQDLTARQGIVWFRWRGWDYTLRKASMMIRPRYFGKDREKQEK